MTAWSRRVPAVPREEERRKGEISPLKMVPTHQPDDATDNDKPGQRGVSYRLGKIRTFLCMLGHYNDRASS